ncbi:MAG: response regulator [Bradyrhizobium sp.]|uniref:response regulator n=1 Tax=Bradyrhizobium sp. TaxID=376 RepID=UPI00271A7442|nr:response regulator [Bradyrhizobium sp.]MDO8397942.1 response regulator [Bradyrhizobium sp.]
MTNKILLIEDNEQNRYLATFLLEKSGYSVVPASNGPTGVELGSSFRPKGILLDIQLPGMDGYQVARALRLNPSLNDVPIIAVTSYAMAGDREKAMEAGCDGYIEKPIDPETFVSEIEKFFRRGPS